MKEETKKKIKKIAKVSGFIITFGFAVFGALCAAMLMANASGAKDNIKTLDNSLVQNEVRSERNSKPRKAPNVVNGHNLLEEGVIYNNAYLYANQQGGNCNRFSGYNTIRVNLGAGYYYLDTSNNKDNVVVTRSNSSFISDFEEWYNGSTNGYLIPPEDVSKFGLSSFDISPSSRYLTLNGDMEYWFSGLADFKLYLVDTLEVPAQDVVSLPSKWSPLGMFGGSISEDGNILTNTEWVTGYEEKITLKGFLFRNQGIVYNRMRIILYWLGGTGAGNTEVGYVDAKGDFHVGLSSQWCIRSIEYAYNPTDDVNNNVDDLYRFTAGQTRIDFTNTKVSVYPGIVWQNEGANVLEIIDKNYSSNGKRYTYGGLSIGGNLNDFEFLMKYNNIVGLEVMGDTSLVFALMSSAFGSVTPLLSIAILPNITLGMLLFFPLVGAIIVIIIKVIKK